MEHLLAIYINFATASAPGPFSTTSVGTLVVDNVVTSGGTVLSENLPKVFGFAIALSISLLVFFWIRGMIRRPR